MKAFVYILSIAACVAYAQEVGPDPFAPGSKKAAALAQCASGHKTLRDVPVVNGRPTGDPEIAAKVESGEIILGGCTGGQDFQVVCKTCGLAYDDVRDAWEESFPPNPFAPDSEKNPRCTAATIRGKFSKEFQDITLDVAGEKSSFPTCARWHDGSGIVGELVMIETQTITSDVQPKIEEWLRKLGGLKNPSSGISKDTDRRWEWTDRGRCFEVHLSASVYERSLIVFEWHTQKKAAGE